MSSILNTKIQLRTDLRANWESANPVLKLGEIAIVCFDNDYKDIKIGNGISSFNELSYLYQSAISADTITGKDLHVKSIAQGYNVKATPTSLATGVYTRAEGNFDVVHGIEAKAKVGDDYSFVFNGENLPFDGQNFYESHGEGTFNINPLSGLSGIYIGERSLASILSTYLLSSEISNYYKTSETSSSNEISDAIAGLGGSIAAEAAARAAEDEKLSSEISSLSNQLSDYYKTTETSSKYEISSALDSKIKIGSYANGSYNLSSSDLSVVKIAADDYYRMVSEEKTVSSVIYIVSSDNINAHGERIICVADPISSDDAATKNYVDNSLSGRLLSTDLSFNYDSNTKYIYLKAFNSNIGTVNCADFIKDGMLSSVYLTGNTLVLVFNTDAGKTPISVNLSSFVDNYDQKIQELSNAISTIGEDYLDSSDKEDILNQCLQPDEVTLYKGPGNKDITLSVGTGGTLRTYTATLYDFYLNSETSSASEISDAIDGKIKTGNYVTGVYNLSSSNLSIVNIKAEDYYELVANKQELSNVFYVLSSDQLNALGNQIIKVGEPELPNDAATKNYVDTHSMSQEYVDGRIKIGKYYDKKYDLSAHDLSVIKIGIDDFCQIVSNKQELSDALYVISSDNLNAFGERIIKVGEPELSNDATTKNYVDTHTVSKEYVDTYTATKDYVNTGLDQKVQMGSYADQVYDLLPSDLSVVRLSEKDYLELLAEEEDDEHVLYVTSSDVVNACDRRIIDVAEPELSNDAATKNYVDSSLTNSLLNLKNSLSDLNYLDSSQNDIDTIRLGFNAILQALKTL